KAAGEAVDLVLRAILGGHEVLAAEEIVRRVIGELVAVGVAPVVLLEERDGPALAGQILETAERILAVAALALDGELVGDAGVGDEVGREESRQKHALFRRPEGEALALAAREPHVDPRAVAEWVEDAILLVSRLGYAGPQMDVAVRQPPAVSEVPAGP